MYDLSASSLKRFLNKISQCIEIAPLVEKFGEELGHRDYLGALMNLGIERSTLGDIIIDGKHAFLFCTEKMLPVS